MTNLFIFTASDEAARPNFVHTIEEGGCGRVAAYGAESTCEEGRLQEPNQGIGRSHAGSSTRQCD